jgi:hypothetical protein
MSPPLLPKRKTRREKKKHTTPNISPHRSHRSRMLVLQYAEEEELEEEEIHERHRSRKRINAIHKHSTSIIKTILESKEVDETNLLEYI